MCVEGGGGGWYRIIQKLIFFFLNICFDPLELSHQDNSNEESLHVSVEK